MVLVALTSRTSSSGESDISGVCILYNSVQSQETVDILLNVLADGELGNHYIDGVPVVEIRDFPVKPC